MVLLRFDLVTYFLTRYDLFFYCGLAFIKMSIFTKFHENWIKTMPSEMYSWIY